MKAQIRNQVSTWAAWCLGAAMVCLGSNPANGQVLPSSQGTFPVCTALHRVAHALIINDLLVLSLHRDAPKSMISQSEQPPKQPPLPPFGVIVKCSGTWFLNKLWTICARSLELLSEDSYVDCADRERVEWTDDSPPAFDCTRVMMRGPEGDGNEYWGDSRLLKALLRRIALTQQADGQMKAHSCSERWDIHAIMKDRSCDWVIQLRQYVESSGDVALVNELWLALTRLMAWFMSRRSVSERFRLLIMTVVTPSGMLSLTPLPIHISDHQACTQAAFDYRISERPARL